MFTMYGINISNLHYMRAYSCDKIVLPTEIKLSIDAHIALTSTFGGTVDLMSLNRHLNSNTVSAHTD